MKMWTRRDEWVELALCVDSDIHTMENPAAEHMQLAAQLCGQCRVRPECIEWAVRESACAVVVAGTYLPDPQNKKELKSIYHQLRESLPNERKARGDDI
jgi:hypothetical protein